MLNVGIHNKRKKSEAITAGSVDGEVVFDEEGKVSKVG